MTGLPPTKFSAPKIRLKRTARRLLWTRPAAYFPFGILRGRGNVFRKNVDLFMAGYPRCGNTFTRVAFLSANPGVPILTHQCVPSFVLHLAHCEIPGLMLIRNPLDSAVSWAIHQNLSVQEPGVVKRFTSSAWHPHHDLSLEEAVAFWNDYHETLLPVRSQLFVARFEEVTKDFGAVMKNFNTRWGTDYVPFEHTVENAARCFQVTENEHTMPNGKILEMQVCRPSKKRDIVKETCLDQMEQSSFLREELARAKELYDAFVIPQPATLRKAVTPLVPTLFGGEVLPVESAVA